MALRDSTDYHLRQSLAPGRYFLDRINYTHDNCPYSALSAGVECSTIYPVDGNLVDTESTLRGITSIIGTALRDSVAQRAQETHRPFELPSMQTPPPPTAHAFRGSIRGATTSIDLDRIQPRFFVDDVDLQQPECVLVEDANRFGRIGANTRTQIKDAAQARQTRR